MAKTMALFHSNEIAQYAEGEIAELFNAYDNARSAHLERAREYAELTIPSVLPPDGFTENSELIVPDSSLGAKLVTNLSSRIVSAALPAGLPFIRASLKLEEMDTELLQQIMDDQEYAQAIDEDLALVERMIIRSLEQHQARLAVQLGVEHCAITGTQLAEKAEDGTWRVYRLDNYVIVRQPNGAIIEVITRDVLDASYLPDIEGVTLTAEDRANGVPLFKHVKHIGNGKWERRRQVKDVVLSEVEELDYNPFVAARWKPTINEHYGRSHVEENVGDLRTYEGLQTAIREAAAIMARINPLVHPNQSYTRLEDLVRAENGQPIAGRGEDVDILESSKARDMAFVASYAEVLEQRLGYSFAVNSAVQPEGERITATQIRNLSSELDAVLGGIFISLTNELIQPIIELEYRSLKPLLKGVTSDLPVEVKLTTGIEALGREQDKANLLQVAQGVQMVDPEGTRLNKGQWLHKWLLAHSIDPTDLVITDEEAQSRSVQEQVTQQAIQTGGAIAEKAIPNN